MTSKVPKKMIATPEASPLHNDSPKHQDDPSKDQYVSSFDQVALLKLEILMLLVSNNRLLAFLHLVHKVSRYAVYLL